MEVSLNIPDDLAKQLNMAGDLSRLALEGLAIEGYRHEALSLGELAELLGMSVYEADGFLKSHGVPAAITLDELREQTAALDALLSK
jgi:predicted HTH domain antitoxin